jgi:hypothetical protein
MKKPKTVALPAKMFLYVLPAVLGISIIIIRSPKTTLTASSQIYQATASPTIFALEYVVITETPIPTPTSTPTPSPTCTPTPLPFTSTDYEKWFTTYSNNQSINKELLKRIAFCESGLNPGAINGIYGGLYQFSTNSWISARKSMNQDSNPDLRFNPEEAIKTAAFKIATAGIRAWPNCSK